MILKFRARALLDAKNLKKLGWREIGVLLLKGLLAIFIAHMSPVVLLGGMYLNFVADLSPFLSYLFSLSGYFIWILIQIYIFKNMSVNLTCFFKLKFLSVCPIFISLFPISYYHALVFYHDVYCGYRGDEGWGMFLAFFALIPVFVILSFLCFIHQTYCLVRSRKRPPPFSPGA